MTRKCVVVLVFSFSAVALGLMSVEGGRANAADINVSSGTRLADVNLNVSSGTHLADVNLNVGSIKGGCCG